MPASTRVDFYILEAADSGGRLHFACRLAEKAYGLGNKVYAHTATDHEADQLDDLLWTFRQGSFVPHERITGAGSSSPVSIGTPDAGTQQGEVLINLSDTTPEFVGNFSRVAEIIDSTQKSREAGRLRFRQYKAMGLQPETHKIG